MACYLCGYPSVNMVKRGIRNDEGAVVVECTKCTLQWVPKLLNLDPDILAKYYEDQTYRDERASMEGTLEDRYNRDREFALRRRDQLFSYGPLIGKNVLDVGAGSGAFANVARMGAGDGGDIVAVEPNDEDRKFIQNHVTNVITSPTLSDLPPHFLGYFDFITLFHVVEHVQDPQKLLHEASGFLSPGGVMIIETPNANDAMIDVYKVEAFRDQWYQNAHIWYFNHSTLSRLCQSVGGLEPAWNTRHGKWSENRAAGYVQRYGLSNHLQWMMGTERPGHELLPFLGENRTYNNDLIKSGRADTLWFALKKEIK